MKASHRSLAWTLLLAGIFLALLTLVSIKGHVPMSTLTRDPAALEQYHPLKTGFLSNIGVLLWCAAAAICFFSSKIAFNRGASLEGRFLAGSALLTSYLLFDDFFMFHETLAREFFGIMKENDVYIITVTISVIYGLIFFRTILKTEYLIFALALTFLAASLGIDALLPGLSEQLGEWSFLLEDGLKFLGIVTWLHYFADTSYRFVVNKVENIQ